MWKLFVFIFLTNVNRSALASCGSYDIEAVYGAYDWAHTVLDFTYALDTSTMDMVVGGTVTLWDGNPSMILYYIDDENCEVEWHYQLYDYTS